MAEIRTTPAEPAETSASEQGAQNDTTTRAATPAEPAEPAQGDVQEDGEEAAGADAAPKPGGRFARLREQLTTAEQRVRDYEQRLQTVSQREQHALAQFVDLVLPDATYRQLEIQARNGDWEAKQKLDQADAWRGMAAPIADLAHRAVQQQFNQDLQSLRTLDGMDGDSHQKLVAAATPGEKLKLAWTLAHKAASDASRERISALEAEVANLKTTKAANGAEPAAGGGRANGSTLLAGWLGDDGLPTEEAIQRARNGGFRDLGTTVRT